MRHAHYELMENGRFFARIPKCPGLWAEGATLEDWIMIKLRHGDHFEAIDGVDINPQPEYAEADQTA